MSHLTKISSRLSHMSNISNMSKGPVTNSLVQKPNQSLVDFSSLGNKGHCGCAGLTRMEQQTVIMSSPPDLKEELGSDKYYAEMSGSNITAVAATLKLLAEERLRRETNTLQIPISQILRETPQRRNFSPRMIKMILTDL